MKNSKSNSGYYVDIDTARVEELLSKLQSEYTTEDVLEIYEWQKVLLGMMLKEDEIFTGVERRQFR